MGLNLVPTALRSKYRVEEREHACAILNNDFPNEFRDICDCLNQFVLKKSDILVPGGRKSPIAKTIDNSLHKLGWGETSFKIHIRVDGTNIPVPTHKIDNFKNRVGLEVEWNNKDPFYDRDLNNFRLLRDLHVLSVGVMITRLTELNLHFEKLGASTTHWDKLIPKVDGGGAGGCPLLLVGMGMACYDASL
jgi:hypothetical protein